MNGMTIKNCSLHYPLAFATAIQPYLAHLACILIIESLASRSSATRDARYTAVAKGMIAYNPNMETQLLASHLLQIVFSVLHLFYKLTFGILPES